MSGRRLLVVCFAASAGAWVGLFVQGGSPIYAGLAAFFALLTLAQAVDL